VVRFEYRAANDTLDRPPVENLLRAIDGLGLK
jgi:hypothetical protein